MDAGQSGDRKSTEHLVSEVRLRSLCPGETFFKKLSLIIFNLNYLTFLGFDYMHDTQILPIKIYIISIILKYTIICMFMLL